MENVLNFHRPYRNLLVALGLFISTLTIAQPTNEHFGFGLQLGEPAGLSFKIYQPNRMSVDILLAWDLDDFFFANVHGIWEQPISSVKGMHFFYGPGIFLGFRDRHDQLLFDSKDKINLGISGTFGLNYYADRFEIYLRITPRLLLLERTDGELGGGLGVRYFI